jgi:hypothetical protein
VTQIKQDETDYGVTWDGYYHLALIRRTGPQTGVATGGQMLETYPTAASGGAPNAIGRIATRTVAQATPPLVTTYGGATPLCQDINVSGGSAVFGHALTEQALDGTLTCRAYEAAGRLVGTEQFATATGTLLTKEVRKYTNEGRLATVTDLLGQLTVYTNGGGWITDARQSTGYSSAGFETGVAKYGPTGQCPTGSCWSGTRRSTIRPGRRSPVSRGSA